MRKLLSAILCGTIILGMSGCSDRSEKYQDCEPGNRYIMLDGVMETDNGYYARRINHMGNMLELCYYDKESGKAIYLCSKPECSHDGGEFCTATDKDIEPDHITMSDGYVYISGTEYSKADETLSWKLYRANADGTEFTEVCTFQKQKNLENVGRAVTSTYYMDDLIIHRGYAIVPFYDYENPSLMYDCVANTMIIDLENGQCKRLPALDYDITKLEHGQLGYYVEGDYLYYYIEPPTYINTRHLYRYNLVTGETERIETNTRLWSFVVLNDVVYYITVPTEEQNYIPFYAYDIATGEEKDLSAKLSPYNSGGREPHLNSNLVCDGKYVYFMSPFYNGKWGQFYFMMSEDMETQVHFEAPKEMQDYYTELKLSNGKAYFVGEVTISNGDAAETIEDIIWVTSSIAYGCPVEDIAAGNPEWTLAYDFTEFEMSLMGERADEII